MNPPGEQIVSEKQDEASKMIEKMRTNTEKQNRKTGSRPLRRSGKKLQKSPPKEEQKAGTASRA